MANRAVAKKVFDWAAISARIPQSARADFASLRAAYTAALTGLEKSPAEPAPIDWQHYSQTIHAPNFVDGVKKAYESLTFEYPADTTTESINADQKAAEKAAQELIAITDRRIAELEAELAAVHAEKPLDQVTVDEFLADKPEWSRAIKAEIDEHKYQ